MGATSITLNVIEQDYKAAFENISLVISLARTLGLKVYALPDGWGNLTGNISGFPSVQAVKKRKDCLADNENNLIMTDKGWLLNPNNKQVFKFFKKKLKEILEKFDFDGLFWYHPDDRTELVKLSGLFKLLHGYVIEKYPDKAVFYHPKNNSFFDDINVEQTMTSYILPKTEQGLSNWTKPDKLNIMLSYFDYPPNIEQPEEFMTLMSACFMQLK